MIFFYNILKEIFRVFFRFNTQIQLIWPISRVSQSKEQLDFRPQICGWRHSYLMDARATRRRRISWKLITNRLYWKAFCSFILKKIFLELKNNESGHRVQGQWHHSKKRAAFPRFHAWETKSKREKTETDDSHTSAHCWQSIIPFFLCIPCLSRQI